MTKRTHDVQVPGAPAEATEATNPEVQADLTSAEPSQPVHTADELLAKLAALEAENARLKAAAEDQAVPAEISNPSTKYADVHSTKVDKTKITAPVLCKDGWLVPG